MDKNVSYFKNLIDVSSNKTLEDILKLIKSVVFKNEVEEIRKLIASGDNKLAADLKKKLHAFTVSGTFNEKRNAVNIDHYSALVVLDYDKLNKDQLNKLKDELRRVDFVYSFFVSPSGNGLKVIVPVDSDLKNHEKAFAQVVKVFNELFEIPIDTSGKDVSRLCFMSYDPDLYLNPNASVFKVQLEDSLDYEAALFQATLLTQRKFSFDDGNRNNYIHHLACNANRLAVPYDFAESSILSAYDLDEDEVLRTVKAVYSKNKEEHGKNKQKKSNIDLIEELLLSRYEFRYNEITGRAEMRDKKIAQVDFAILNDFKENSILRWLLKKGVRVSQTLLRSLIRSDFSKNYNAFEEYFNSLPVYDGKTDYIQDLASTVKTHNDDLWQLVLKKWIVGLVACAITDNTNHLVLVFAGSQGIGKTTWILNLIPSQLRSYVFSGNINPNNKDTLVQLSECILINMDELETLNKSEIGSLKEIITKESIRIRKAYGVNQENMSRRASFSGSVNAMQFLNDMTGSRRFLCFDVSKLDYLRPVNFNGVYSQALWLLKNNFQYWLNQEEIDLISRNNDQFQIASPEEELLLAYFKPIAVNDADLLLTNSEIIKRITFKAGITNNSVRARALGNALLKNQFIRMKKNGAQVYAVYEKTMDEIDQQFRKD